MIHYCIAHAIRKRYSVPWSVFMQMSIGTLPEIKSTYIKIKYTVQLDNMGVLPAVATLLDPPPPLPIIPTLIPSYSLLYAQTLTFHFSFSPCP